MSNSSICSDKIVIKSTVGIIAGLAVIGLIMVLIVFCGIFWCYRKRRQVRVQIPSSPETKGTQGRSFSELPPFPTFHHVSSSVKEMSQELRYTTPGDSTIQVISYL